MNSEIICPCCGNKIVLSVLSQYCECDEKSLATEIEKAGYTFGVQKGGEKE